jgi:hypothetical protein
MLNQCPTMSTDRLQRIAEGTRHGDKNANPATEMAGGAIQLSSRVFVSCSDKKTRQKRIWIGRVQKMGRKVDKRTIEYHRPVHLDRIPDGGFLYCHWYGQFPNTTNKWEYGVAGADKIEMSQIKGVLKQRLTPAKTQKQKKRYKNAMALCKEDLAKYTALDEKELGNRKLFA